MADNIALDITHNADEVVRDLHLVDVQVMQGMAKSAEQIERETKRLLNETTKTWTRRPQPIVLTETRGNELTVLAGMDSRIWNMLNVGTRPHIIVPRRARMLRFRSQYAAKTTPGALRSDPGGASGDLVFRRMVRHPGTRARRWDLQLQRRMENFVPTETRRQLRRAVRL